MLLYKRVGLFFVCVECLFTMLFIVLFSDHCCWHFIYMCLELTTRIKLAGFSLIKYDFQIDIFKSLK